MNLRDTYPPPLERAVLKSQTALDGHMKAFIAASPFLCLATSGAGGADVTPRGDRPGFVHVPDDHTLLVPDWPGNNRLDSLGNVLENSAVGLLFFVPGVVETLRVNGHAEVSMDETLVARWDVGGKRPRSVLWVRVDEAFMHCGKALIRARLWAPEAQIDRASLPSYGQMLKDQTRLPVSAEDIQQSLEDGYKNRLDRVDSCRRRRVSDRPRLRGRHAGPSHHPSRPRVGEAGPCYADQHPQFTNEEILMPVQRRSVLLLCLFVLGAATAGAQTRGGVMADLAKDIAEVETKIVGLANAIPESAWEWRPGPGVRSVGEVFTHVAADNYFMPAALGTATPKEVGISGTDYKTVGVYEGRKRSRAEIIAEMQRSFAFLKAAMAAAPADKLDAPMKVFGTETTARATWIGTTTHLHEHLGQLIAYARSNKVVPPWSK